MILVILQGLCQLLQGEGGPQGEQAWQVGARRGQFSLTEINIIHLYIIVWDEKIDIDIMGTEFHRPK